MAATPLVASCGAASGEGPDDGALFVADCPGPDATTLVLGPRSAMSPEATEAARWLATPYPGDHRRPGAGEGIDLADFPNPEDVPLLDAWIEETARGVDGFGTTSPIHFRFTGPVDPASLPQDPAAFDRDAAIRIVDLTEGS
ncbi:MAG TPA: hypothetical protein RMF84_07345, partial [Polyangiaceae bacterium LLY-WYZ-14_1]|nr:hypothetical protein [Polyangiaceae bacterium LLY-WYZ-14_1]